eukprot:NODE_2715_length_1136_cov_22.777369_g2493_i0.p1 GENE.NODE_2715_length_1136_cov_22.777369_g2493_i0~~NODE_2715_length_1136_cov_22.777369_g2493_i0.p1  ORF type:complete len:273 (-),score=66.03 NODE_2715_length_1136_cov_22.777369_g2493_i0:278-1096(-)
MHLLFKKEEKFDKLKLKTSLKMSITRMQMQTNKRENAVKLQQREIAALLQKGKTESALIKVESVIRDQYLIECYELLSLLSELMSARLQLIAEARSCPPDLKEAVSTMIWSAPRIDNIPEFLTIREQLARKFGKEFVQAAAENAEMAVHPKVYYRLSLQVPEPYLCQQQLKSIADSFDIDWEPPADPHLPSTGLGSGLGILPDGPLPMPPSDFPSTVVPEPPPYNPEHNEAEKDLGGFDAPASSNAPTTEGDDPAFDFASLEARFEALKRMK